MLNQEEWKRILCLMTFLILPSCFVMAQEFTPEIPNTWVDEEMESLELPLVQPEYSPKSISASYYSRFPVLTIYKSYPVYHPDYEPPGYLDKLRQMEPVILWDGEGKRPKLKTKADWIRAGELVFDAPLVSGGANSSIAATERKDLPFRDREWYKRIGVPITKEGIVPFYRYVIRKKGTIRSGILSCSMCHTRVMKDGTALIGPQGNFPFSRAMADDYRNGPSLVERHRRLEKRLYHVPLAKTEST